MGFQPSLSPRRYNGELGNETPYPMKIGPKMDLSIGKWESTPLRFREMQAKYILPDGTEGALLINNITNRGMGCHCGTTSIETGQEISVELPFLGIRAGTVRWVKDGDCGILMAQSLDVDCLKLYSNMEIPDAA